MYGLVKVWIDTYVSVAHWHDTGLCLVDTDRNSGKQSGFCIIKH